MNTLRHIGKRPIWISGIIANLLIVASTVRFFRLPYGSGLNYEDWLMSFIIPVSALSFIVGVVLWGRGSRLKAQKPTIFDNVGLLLNLVPFWLALLLLHLAFNLRGLWDNG